MDQKNYMFKIPPPPPTTVNYVVNPPLPPPPTVVPQVAPPPPPPQVSAQQNWNNWSFDFSRPPPPVFNNSNNSVNQVTPNYNARTNSVPLSPLSPSTTPTDISYYGVNQDASHYYGNRQYTQRRFNVQQNWGQRNNFKKVRYDGRSDQNVDQQDRNYYRNNADRYRNTSTSINDTSNNEIKYQDEGHRARKRKKPLSQSIPAKRAWTDEEAQMAIEIEREYNKSFRNNSLKIKFPDQELNRDIVSKFHNSIETVYFQQPSNPRFCFVTLTEGSDPNSIIEELNKIKFGLGYLSAEYKKDREEEQNVGPDDIDPLTLYVGNLAQEVTKEDMVNFYPKNKRIDIGFAKKMRYTRYAFVSFKNVQDSIEAFKATHCADLHSKSMIVRFRRLHGTVGMPGETKIQQPPRDERKKESNSDSEKQQINLNSNTNNSLNTTKINDDSHRTNSECSDSSIFDTSLVKNEPFDYSDDEFHSDEDEFDDPHQQYLRTLENRTHKKTIESQNITSDINVKKEPEFNTPFLPDMADFSFPVRPIPLKEEPISEEDNIYSTSKETENNIFMNGLVEPKKEIDNEPVDPEENEEEFNMTTDFESALNNLRTRSNIFP